MSKGKFSEENGIYGVVDCVTEYGTPVTSGWIKLTHGEHYGCIVIVGDITGSGTVDAKVQQASAADGTGAKDITGKALTRIVASGDKVQSIIDVSIRDLDTVNGFYWIQLQISPATANSSVGGLVIGSPSYKPATGDDLTTVTQVK